MGRRLSAIRLIRGCANELNTGLTVFDSQGSMQVGDKVTMEIDGRSVEIEIAGLLSASPFNSAGDSAIIIAPKILSGKSPGKKTIPSLICSYLPVPRTMM